MTFEPGRKCYYHRAGKCGIMLYLPVWYQYSCLKYCEFHSCFWLSSFYDTIPSSCVLDIPGTFLEHQYYFLFFPVLTREEFFCIRETNTIARLGLTKIVLINMWFVYLVMFMIVLLAWLLLWEDEADLHGQSVCHREVVSIMIGPVESNCRF